MAPSKLLFYVNGKKIEEENADPETTLLSYLRLKLNLTGTKLGCGEGGCGACTVMVSRWDKLKNKITHISVNACLAPLPSLHHTAVTTIEGIGNTGKLHVVQERLARFHGSQCGFCTPGIVMSMYTLLRNHPVPTTTDIDVYLQGNLCRCTGYRPILSAFETFTEGEMSNGVCGMGNKCCKLQNGNGVQEDEPILNGDDALDGYVSYDPTQEPIFPPHLLLLKDDISELKFIGERSTWYVPTTLEKFLILREKFPHSRVIGGNTEVGIETQIKGFHYEVFLSPQYVNEMNKITVNEKGVSIGGACTLAYIEENLRTTISEREEYFVQVLQALVDMLHWFAGTQIRNVSAIGGNIMTSSPISDINPILVASSSTLTFSRMINGKIVTRDVVLSGDFFTSYRRTATHPEEILTNVFMPFTDKDVIFRAYKQSKRREDDIAIVNAAFLVKFDKIGRIEYFSTAFGGMAPTTVQSNTTMERSIGRYWDNSFLEDTCMQLMKDHPLPGSAPGGMVNYRKTLVQSLFTKFFYDVARAKTQKLPPIESPRPRISATQTFEGVDTEQNKTDQVGRPLMHLSALKQVTGEARYVDDMPLLKDELFICFVTSTEAYADIVNIDITEASQSNGFVTFVDKNDVPGDNLIWREDTVYADEKVTCVGHIIGGVVADTAVHAARAARLVKVEYKKRYPVIITIEDAMKHNSYHELEEGQMYLDFGDAESEFKSCENVLTGEVKTNPQDHFYLETQACCAIPKLEDGEMEIFASSQHTALTQSSIASALGVDRNKILVRVKRMGGGFGGKESRCVIVSTPVAVAANKCKKPVRCMLTRQEDMQITGTRHAFYAKYKVGFNNDGRITALHVRMYSNAGNTPDLSPEATCKALFQVTNSYYIPNVNAEAFVCKTNISSNTAFRGFGGPQGMFIAETYVSHVASHLGVDVEKIRRANLWNVGDMTHFSQLIDFTSVRDCWESCVEKSNIETRKKDIETFNRNNRWKKRGIACVPTAFGIAYEVFLNQAGAYVLVYTDGSVLLNHGGTEMGQGLHTKMIQIAGRVLGINHNKIHISETSTNTVPNSSATAASLSSDLYGMAVKDACENIMKRLAPIRKSRPEATWEEIVIEAYFQRIQLSATGFYKMPGIEYDWDHCKGQINGRVYNYFTCGAAVSEVEIDILSGDHTVLQTDLVMDLGRSLNPAVDIGQIEGGFIQGYGLFTMEEPLYASNGRVWTIGPGAYKIPGFDDIPRAFNVHLLPKSENKRAIYSSKAVGEPPLFLASSVFFAIKEAITAARKQSGTDGYFRMDSPASAERIRMLCCDQITERVEKDEDMAALPWAVRA